MERKSVLLVEDDHELVELLKIHLADLNCEVDIARNGDDGLTKALAGQYDLCVLDIMLPGTDGLEVCRKLRAKEKTIPILMLTAKAEEIDRVVGLEMGADDYLTKPFSVREFVARVKAIFRRMEMLHSPQNRDTVAVLDFGRLKIDVDKHKVTINNNRIDLSPKEFELLVLLASHPGKSYNRGQILNLIWGYDFEGYEHTVNSHINRLRRKIEPNIEEPQYVLTTWGVGYRFNEEVAITS